MQICERFLRVFNTGHWTSVQTHEDVHLSFWTEKMLTLSYTLATKCIAK